MSTHAHAPSTRTIFCVRDFRWNFRKRLAAARSGGLEVWFPLALALAFVGWCCGSISNWSVNVVVVVVVQRKIIARVLKHSDNSPDSLSSWVVEQAACFGAHGKQQLCQHYGWLAAKTDLISFLPLQRAHAMQGCRKRILSM